MFDLAFTVARLRRLGSDTHDVEAKAAVGGLPANLASTLSAFSNAPGGGVVVLGLDESAGFAAVPVDVAALKAGVARVARDAVEPPATIEFLDGDVDGIEVVVIAVRELPPSAKPSRVRRTGKAYLRSWDGDFELSDVELQGLLVGRDQPRFDAEPVADTALADLDAAAVERYIATARASDRGLARLPDDHDLLLRTGVITPDGEVTVAGILALGDYPQQWFPNYVIQAAVVPSDTETGDARFSDVARFSGPIPQMIDDALIWVAQHSRHAIVETGDGRVRDRFDFPAIAVRELLSNALVHRDLAEWSWAQAIELRIDERGFRLFNPGGLHGLTVDRLLANHRTSARNATLARICQFVTMRDGRVVEALASGIPRILAATEGTGLPAPTFFDQGIAFTAILHRPRVLASDRSTRLSSAERASDDPTPHEALVLSLIGADPVTAANLVELTGLSIQGVRKHLRALIAAGRVSRNGGAGHRTTTYTRR